MIQKVKLHTKVDPIQCQAEIKQGSFMTFSPRHMEQCNNRPNWIIIQVHLEREGSRFTMGIR